MTLDEAIRHAEEVAENKRAESETAEIQGCDRYALKCAKCAEEHRQLAEWLRDYKRLKEKEPSGDLISREDAIKKVAEILKNVFVEYEDIAYKAMNKLPSVSQAQTGHWEHIRCDMYECSECQHIYTDLSCEKLGMNFCPNCGADMREDKDGDAE